MNKKSTNGINGKKLLIIAALALIAVIAVFQIKPKTDNAEKGSTTASNNGGVSVAKEVKDADIVIPVKDITETPSFYPAKIDGINLEVIAVKASDGTIRTAFNTCQVCYSSGKGYYKVEDNQLVCQNCGNRFGMDEVEVTKGGCNPVPITDEYKAVNDDTITISKDFLTQATVIFQNWK
jgi:uncharacterized membrane protein